ncbi:cytochrome P450 [Halomarina salina]|uniref:Cytochrome P450 n=1 Tax=Halomarina salina TaxID=1872699 RepID=A0ABD5RRW7_9EURY|nr:cytochrome P450 [Halomarina salina]
MARSSTFIDESDLLPRDPPGPERWNWLSLARQFLSADTTETLAMLREDYGDVVKVYFDGEAYVVSNPTYVQHVLEANQGNYAKADVYDEELGEVFGQGLLTAEPATWQRQQELIRPMFMPATIRTFADLVAEETRAMLDRWKEYADRGEPIDLLSETERVTLLIIGKAMFSEDMADEADRMQEALHVFRDEFKRQTRSVGPTLPRWVPTPHNRQMEEALDYLNGFVYDLIEKRRGREDEFDDLLTMLLQARTDDDERMADEQIRDEIVTFLLAGHETTATALAWTWYLLAHHPEQHRRLHDAALDAPWLDGDSPDPTRFEEGPFVKQCVQEGMRIYPPVPAFSRQAIDSDRLGPYQVDPGTELIMSQFLVHRDPSIWDDPLDYRPDRFDGDGPDCPRYGYFPFGGGARMCIGREFSLLEARIILGMAVRDVKLELESPDYHHYDDIGRDSAVTMTPAERIEMRVGEWE